MNKTRKIFVITSLYALTAALVMAGLLWQAERRSSDYRRMAEHASQRAFSELAFTMDEINSSLQKAIYSTTPQMISTVCCEIYGKATAAQMSAGELPLSSEQLETTAGFIARLGDYVLALSKKTAAGIACTDEEYDNLTALSKSASALSEHLTQLYGSFDIADTAPVSAPSPESLLPADIGESLRSMEEQLPDIPSLIYDGPFSKHIEDIESAMLKDAGQVEPEEAAQSAAGLLGIPAEKLVLTLERSGKIPVYIFEAASAAGAVCAEVTRAGGEVLSIRTSASGSRRILTPQNAEKLAENFLRRNGYASMEPSYYMTDGGELIANFAYVQNGVICYPDLIKVGISLENGVLTGFEAAGYLTNHRVREIPEPKVSEEEALALVSPRLHVLSHCLAIIPSDGRQEIFCHEFKCENADGRHFIVYINAEEAREEKMLILIESEDGTLTV